MIRKSARLYVLCPVDAEGRVSVVLFVSASSEPGILGIAQATVTIIVLEYGAPRDNRQVAQPRPDGYHPDLT